MFSPRAMLEAAVGYVRKNPDEVVRQAVSATGLKFGVPLATLRWFAGNLTGKKAPKDVEITSAAPALRFSAVVDAMGTPVRASAAIKIDEVSISPDSIRVTIRLREVNLALAGPSNDTPVATLIQSGALDLSKPGNLVKFIPKKPAAIVEADGDRIVIDLMKVPKLAADARIQKILGILSPVLGIRAIETDRDHLWIKLRATPAGLPAAITKLRDATR
ncbi:MAG: hypothetical protein JWP97_3406 [Labilithrix sp.]|nr:hypothetical protein [Labilithrix sp.]